MKIGLEIVFWGSLRKKKSPPRLKKNIWFFIDATLVFFKGVNPWFWSKHGILSLYVFVQMVLEIMFDDHWGRKQALFDYENLAITKSPYWDFFKGVNPRFWLKIGNYPFVRNSLEIMTDDHLVKSQALSQSKVLATFSLATNYSACMNFCPKLISQSAMHSVSQPASQPVS